MYIFNPRILGPALLFITTISYAETNHDAHKLDLNQAIELGLRISPHLKSIRLEIESKQMVNEQARLRPNPEFEIELENFGGSSGFSRTKNLESTALIYQTIETAKKRHKRSQVLQNEIQILKNKYQLVKCRVIIDIQSSFVKALALQEMDRLNHKLEEIAKKALEVISKRVSLGKVAEVDKERAHIFLMQLNLKHEDTLKDLKTARAILTNLLKKNIMTETVLEGSFESIQNFKSYEVLLEEYKQSPFYNDFKLKDRHSYSIIELEKSKQSMNYDVGVGFRQFNEANEYAFLINVSVVLPFFNRNQGRVKAAKKDLESIREKNIADQIDNNNKLYELWQTGNAQYRKVMLLRDSIIPRSKALFAAMNKGYSSGKFDYLDMFEAHKVYIESRQQYLKSLEDYHLALIKLQALTQSNFILKKE